MGNETKISSAGTDGMTTETERNILRTTDENDWHSLTLIRMAAEMAALWHDFGKAGV